jgi:hypothetical protein
LIKRLVNAGGAEAMRHASTFLLLLIFPLLIPALLVSNVQLETAPRAAGIIMTVQYMYGDRNSEEVFYLQNDHRRKEYRDEYSGTTRADGTADVRYGPRVASITRCDLGQKFELNLEDRQYEAWPYTQTAVAKAESAVERTLTPKADPPGSPTIRIEVTRFDTGERKNFFGHVARHVITTTKQTRLAGSQFQPLEFVMDGWYIDVETRLSCEPWATSGMGLHDRRILPRGSTEKYDLVEKGVPESGLAVEWKNTYHGARAEPNGTKKEFSFSYETKITQFVEKALDPGLFEVPSSYRKVQTIDRNPPMTLGEAWDTTRIWLKGMTDRLIH